MRVSEDRYSRDLKRIHIAKRLIELNVRTSWICAWTGFTVGRVRNLYRSYQPERIKRWRGPSPTRSMNFLRSPLLHSEASAIAGIAYRLKVIPDEPVAQPGRMFEALSAVERMVFVFDLYRRMVPHATLTMEQLILLVFLLAARKDLELGYCDRCRGVLVIDRAGTSRQRCPACRKLGENEPQIPVTHEPTAAEEEALAGNPQQSLF
jgi:hypothetical protein